jgi:very-short-patch-repair endonuclease/superfamily I DNA/RNA helicase
MSEVDSAQGEGQFERSAGDDGLRDRAIRLFEFLKSVQRSRFTPVRRLEDYKREGVVLWLADLPDHFLLGPAHRREELEVDAPALVADRPPWHPPPTVPEELKPWLADRIDDPEREPSLRTERIYERPADDGSDSPHTVVEALDDAPDVSQRFDEWLAQWRAWAAQQRELKPVRESYQQLYSMYMHATSQPEELQLIVAVGCLSWYPQGHELVHRHVITAPASIEFDDHTARILVRPADPGGGLTIEDDALDPAAIPDPARLQALRDAAAQTICHPLERTEAGALARRFVNLLDPDGSYHDDDQSLEAGEGARVAFAPAVILRRRPRSGLVHLFDSIVAQLHDTDEIPAGVEPLINPDRQAGFTDAPEDRSGALTTVGGDKFLPLPVNDRQKQVIDRVDRRGQTLVQGPPGTGKTHTAAALISHLLAQGKRVLVTAHTDRALKEVQDHIPDQIRPLSVAVIGTDRQELAHLNTAVRTIGQRAAEHDPAEADQTIRGCLGAIDELQRQRASLYRQLVDAREVEVRHHAHGSYHGTLAAIAQAHQHDRDRYGWIDGLVQPVVDEQPPVCADELGEWLTLVHSAEIRDHAEAARADIVELDALLDSDAFAALIREEARTAQLATSYEVLQAHDAFTAVAAFDSTTRGELQGELHRLVDEADELAGRHEPWLDDALVAISQGKGQLWQARSNKLHDLLEQIDSWLAYVGSSRVETVGELGPFMRTAESLRQHLSEGGRIKTQVDGAPKLGPLTNRLVRNSEPLFEAVHVDGVPPTSTGALDAFLGWARAYELLGQADRTWPVDVEIPPQDTLYERRHWHDGELSVLDRVLALSEQLEAQNRKLQQWGITSTDWSDLADVRTFAQLVDAAAATEAHEKATAPLDDLEATLAAAAGWADASPVNRALRDAVHTRSPEAYRENYAELRRLHEIRQQLHRLQQLDYQLRLRLAELRQAAMTGDPATWASRLADFEGAWQWAETAEWIRARTQVAVNAIQAELNDTDDRIRTQVERLTAARAWSHAVDEARLGGQQRADLEQYAQLVRSIGKGTGRHAAYKRAQARRAMDRCRPAVPVWIMPIYRITEQLNPSPNMFDVVIVDEASQAGTEATFLQYLAPKIVVIGDDKQVSPAAVGVERDHIRQLARQFLHDDRYRATWEDPQRSLFDEARMRYGDLITLTEHRRCVPEIINFSNRVAYEPDNIRLIPVRQYGADRLEPIKTVFVENGYQGGNRINRPEAERLAEQVEKCAADSRYEKRTFGVISLIGKEQAKFIEQLLLERLEAEVLQDHQLRCGDSAAFQGSERDVMFLSMVSAPSGNSLKALTGKEYVQRFNVAASRAKDQMWVFHSAMLEDFANPQDIRYQLLDYCRNVAARDERDDTVTTAVPEDRLIEPFESLFEQRVANRLIERGYTVVPQYPVGEKRIDLVVVGGERKIAIECDGDHWHGPEQYEADMARQRDLERSDWRFFRVRESEFYLNSAEALAPLWETLDQLGIEPNQWCEAPDATPSGADAAEDTIRVVPPPPPPREGQRSTPTPAADSDDEGLGPPAATSRNAEPDGQVRNELAQSRLPTGDLDEPNQDASSLLQAGREGAATTNAPPGDGAEHRLDTGEHEAHEEAAEAEEPPAAERAAGSPWSSSLQLEPHDESTGSTADPYTARRQELIAGLEQIAAQEGPLLGERLHKVYVQAAGGSRVGRELRRILNSAIGQAVRRGQLIQSNPLGLSGVRPKTYRLPGQPEVRPRTPGPRRLHELPPRELAAVMKHAAASAGWHSEERLFRSTLELLGFQRLTERARTRLREVKPLARME